MLLRDAATDLNGFFIRTKSTPLITVRFWMEAAGRAALLWGAALLLSAVQGRFYSCFSHSCAGWEEFLGMAFPETGISRSTQAAQQCERLFAGQTEARSAERRGGNEPLIVLYRNQMPFNHSKCSSGYQLATH